MYFTDDSLLPENQAPLMITAAPYGPMWIPEDCTPEQKLPVTWDDKVQATVDSSAQGSGADLPRAELLLHQPRRGRHPPSNSRLAGRGATRDEILLVLKCGVGLAVHSCSLGAPILLEEMKSAGVKSAGGPKPETPACDAMRAMGQWNTAWDPFFELSPGWTDQFFAFGASVYKSGVFTPKFVELLSIAFDASITHMYAPGTRRHIKAALKLGATPEEIMEVLHICVSMGVQSCAKGVPILAQELEKSGR